MHGRGHSRRTGSGRTEARPFRRPVYAAPHPVCTWKPGVPPCSRFTNHHHSTGRDQAQLRIASSTSLEWVTGSPLPSSSMREPLTPSTSSNTRTLILRLFVGVGALAVLPGQAAVFVVGFVVPCVADRWWLGRGLRRTGRLFRARGHRNDESSRGLAGEAE